jgi:acyl-ACP thioesterase
MEIEITDPPGVGRRFTGPAQVHLADAGPDGRLRVDGLVRFLQDIATDDWTDTGVRDGTTWVVRRTTMALVEGAAWPTLNTPVELATWCSGTGAAWAERRTDLLVGGVPVVRTSALWVPLDPQGRPSRVSAAFHEVYDEAAGGRRVSGRVRAPEVPDAAATMPWVLRRADLDIVAHVNNAVAWAAVVEVATSPLAEAVLVHHGPLEAGDEVTLRSMPGALWLTVDGEVRVSAEFR